MRKLLTIFFALLSTMCLGQTIQYLGSPTTQIYVRGQLRVDTVVYLPLRDTTFTPSQQGAVIYKTSNNLLYLWNGSKWIQVVVGSTLWGQITGTITNQTDLTSYLSSNYQPLTTFGYGLKNSGTTVTYDSASIRKVDTLYRLNDSTLQYVLNGRPYTVLLRGTAAGGISSLVFSMPTVLFNSPVTFANTGGAWTGAASLATQNPNTFLAGPSVGSPATPAFRAVSLADIPTGISNAYLSSMASQTIKANVSGSASPPTDATPTQIAAILPTFGSSTNGLVPAPGSVTGKVLGDDGGWHLPSSSLSLTTNATMGPSPTLVSGTLNIDTNRYAHQISAADYMPSGTKWGDGQIASATASASSSTITISGPNFQPGDVGKVAKLYGSGTGSVAQVGVITSYLSSNQVTVSFTVVTAVAGFEFDWGSDCTIAIQNAILAAWRQGGEQTIDLPVGYSLLNGPLITSDNEGHNPNAQIYFPDTTHTIGMRKTSIRLQGHGSQNNYFNYFGTVSVPKLQGGTILESTLTSASGIRPGIFGTFPATDGAFMVNPLYFNDFTVIGYSGGGKDTAVLTPFSLYYAGQVSATNVDVRTDIDLPNQSVPPGETAGWIVGHLSNNGPNIFTNDMVSGHKYAYIPSEHTIFNGCDAIGNVYGLVIQPEYFAVQGSMLIAAAYCGILFPNRSIMGIPTSAIANNSVNLSIEYETDTGSAFVSQPWFTHQFHVVDSGGIGNGTIFLSNTWGGTGRPANNVLNLELGSTSGLSISIPTGGGLNLTGVNTQLTLNNGSTNTKIFQGSLGGLNITPSGGNGFLSANWLPNPDATYNLGNATYRWADLRTINETLSSTLTLAGLSTVPLDTTNNKLLVWNTSGKNVQAMNWQVPSTGARSVTNNASPQFVNIASNILNIDTLHFRRIFNVVDYGADSTGASDATTDIINTVYAAYAAGNSVVYFPRGKYRVDGPVIASCNCQIPIPPDSSVSIDHQRTIVFEGEGARSPGNVDFMSPFNAVFSKGNGAMIYSTYTGTASIANPGTAIFGSISPSTTYFSLTQVVVKNLLLAVKNNPNGHGPEIGGFSGRYLAGMTVDDCHFQPDTAGNAVAAVDRNVSGFEFPDNGGGSNYYCTNTSASGVRWGLVVGEHVIGDAIETSECWAGIGFKQASHASYFGRVGSQWNVNEIAWYYPTTGHGSGGVHTSIGELDIEYGMGNTGKYYNTVNTVNDSLNYIHAFINYIITDQGGGLNNGRYAVNGGLYVFANQIGIGSNFNTVNYAQRWGDFTIQPYDKNTVVLGSNSYFDGANHRYLDNAYAAGAQFYQGNITLSTGGSSPGTTGNIVPYTYPFLITNTNDVGIGGNMSNWFTPSTVGGKLIVNGTSGNVTIASLATGGTPPTTSGITQMVITDANGQLSFTSIPGGGSSPPFADNTAIAKNNADNTKLLKFDLSGLTTATTRTVTWQDASGTVPLLNQSQTWTNTNTFNSPTFGVIYSGQSGNAPTIVAGAGAGTSPTVAIQGTDNGGLITVTTGTATVGSSSILVTINFHWGFQHNSYPVLSPANATTAALSGATQIYTPAGGTTAWTIQTGTLALAASTTYSWTYSVAGY